MRGRAHRLLTLILAVAALAACTAQPAPQPVSTPVPTSPYVSLLDSPIRGLSPEEIQDLETGAGAGFARAAELNGYPGPRHILDLQDQLGLSADQLAQVQQLYDATNAEARQLGAEILQLEAELELAFRTKTVDEESLEAQVIELADKYGALRLVHLRAHLAAIEMLTPHQLMLYSQLRGYSSSGSTEHDHAHP